MLQKLHAPYLCYFIDSDDSQFGSHSRECWLHNGRGDGLICITLNATIQFLCTVYNVYLICFVNAADGCAYISLSDESINSM